MLDFWAKLFSPSGFVPRAQCGLWTPGLIWLHNISDFLIWSAYLAIPLVLVSFVWNRRRDLPFRAVFALFGIFILACGTTHLMDIVLFYYPMYRFAGLVKLVTAVASWGTVFALTSVVPRALTMRSSDELEREMTARQSAEARLQSAHDNLETRVQERSADLQATSEQLRLSEGVFIC